MHGVSGFDVARQLRSRTELADSVLIALSANADEKSKQMALAAGFDRQATRRGRWPDFGFDAGR